MDIQSLDASYEQLERKQSLIWDNLQALFELDYYSRLNQSDDWANSLAETSRSRAISLKRINDQLFIDNGLLQDQLTQYKRKKEELGFFNRSEALSELDRILNDKSIVRSSREIPIEKRSLLSSTTEEDRVSADELLSIMERDFNTLKSALIEARERTNALFSYLQEVLKQCAELKKRAKQYGRDSTASIDVLVKKLKDLHQRGQLDLFNLPSNPRQALSLAETIKSASNSLELLAKQETQFWQSIKNDSARLIETLNRMRVECLRLEKRATQELGISSNNTPSNKELIQLLQHIETLASDSSKRIELQNELREFQAKCSHRQRLLKSIKEDLETKLTEIDSIKQKWSSLKKRAANAGLSKDKPLIKFTQRAEALLAQQNLTEAKLWIKRYETRLGELTASRN